MKAMRRAMSVVMVAGGFLGVPVVRASDVGHERPATSGAAEPVACESPFAIPNSKTTARAADSRLIVEVRGRDGRDIAERPDRTT